MSAPKKATTSPQQATQIQSQSTNGVPIKPQQMNNNSNNAPKMTNANTSTSKTNAPPKSKKLVEDDESDSYEKSGSESDSDEEESDSENEDKTSNQPTMLRWSDRKKKTVEEKAPPPPKKVAVTMPKAKVVPAAKPKTSKKETTAKKSKQSAPSTKVAKKKKKSADSEEEEEFDERQSESEEEAPIEESSSEDSSEESDSQNQSHDESGEESSSSATRKKGKGTNTASLQTRAAKIIDDEIEPEHSTIDDDIEKVIWWREKEPGKLEYQVKFRGQSYLHLAWLSREYVLEKLGKNRLEKQLRDVPSVPYDENSPDAPPMYTEVDRILAKKKRMVNGKPIDIYLVKWVDQHYSESTWELASDVNVNRKEKKFDFIFTTTLTRYLCKQNRTTKK